MPCTRISTSSRATARTSWCVLAGDHVYKMDFEKVLQHHVDSGADVTVGCLEAPLEKAKSFGVVGIDADRHDHQFSRKAEEPAADARQARRGAVQHGHLCFRDVVPDRPSQGRRGRSEFEPRLRQGYHSPHRQGRQGRRAPLLAVLRPVDRGVAGITGATSEPSTPIGRRISTSPTSSPPSTSMTAPGRSGRTARSRLPRSSCTTAKATVALRFNR